VDPMEGAELETRLPSTSSMTPDELHLYTTAASPASANMQAIAARELVAVSAIGITSLGKSGRSGRREAHDSDFVASHSETSIETTMAISTTMVRGHSPVGIERLQRAHTIRRLAHSLRRRRPWVDKVPWRATHAQQPLLLKPASPSPESTSTDDEFHSVEHAHAMYLLRLRQTRYIDGR